MLGPDNTSKFQSRWVVSKGSFREKENFGFAGREVEAFIFHPQLEIIQAGFHSCKSINVRRDWKGALPPTYHPLDQWS